MTLALVLSPSTADTTRWVVALLLPLLVGLLTKSSASSGMKAVLNTILVALNTAVLAVLDTRGVGAGLIFRQFVQTAVISSATYAGFWKPTGIAGTVAAKTASFGLGSPPVMETADKGAEDQGAVTTEDPVPEGKVAVAKAAPAKKAAKKAAKAPAKRS